MADRCRTIRTCSNKIYNLLVIFYLANYRLGTPVTTRVLLATSLPSQIIPLIYELKVRIRDTDDRIRFLYAFEHHFSLSTRSIPRMDDRTGRCGRSLGTANHFKLSSVRFSSANGRMEKSNR